jgi:phospho-N-acetylmuramoyl-pentapeptide-transferase
MEQRLYNATLMTVPLLFVLAAAPFYIRFLRKRYMGQYIREDGPQSHKGKAGTPTAGGVLILAGLGIGLLAAYAIYRQYYFTEEAWLVIGVILVMGLLGFCDDYLKISKKKNKGVSGYTKLMVQAACGLAVGGYMMGAYHVSHVAVFNWFQIELGWIYPLFAVLVVTGTSNAVNLTDGLDGLAAGTTIISFLALSILFSGSMYVDVAAVYPDLAMICLALMGSILGFFFFNMHPAKLFMGDTGSLALGAALGAMAVLAQVEFWLILIGGVFVLETLSVILQVISFKTTGRRIFRMSPLHHHFELGGWSETKVVSSFIILQVLLCAVAVFLYNK